MSRALKPGEIRKIQKPVRVKGAAAEYSYVRYGDGPLGDGRAARTFDLFEFR